MYQNDKNQFDYITAQICSYCIHLWPQKSAGSSWWIICLDSNWLTQFVFCWTGLWSCCPRARINDIGDDPPTECLPIEFQVISAASLNTNMQTLLTPCCVGLTINKSQMGGGWPGDLDLYHWDTLSVNISLDELPHKGGALYNLENIWVG